MRETLRMVHAISLTSRPLTPYAESSMLELHEQLQPNFWNLAGGLLVNYNASDTLSTTHEFKPLVDPVKPKFLLQNDLNMADCLA